jgi:hypothetical protein
LRIYLDEIGDTREQVSKFKGFIRSLPDTKTIRAAGGLISGRTQQSRRCVHTTT